MSVVFSHKLEPKNHPTKEIHRKMIYQDLQILLSIIGIYFLGVLVIDKWGLLLAGFDNGLFSFPRLLGSDGLSQGPISHLPQFLLLVFASLGIFFLELELDMIQNLFRISYSADDQTVHRLTRKEIFENENRLKILEILSEKPGIHYSALLEETDLFPGQIQWHLKILEEYGLIKKQKLDSFVIYFTKLNRSKLNKKTLLLNKSKITSHILQIIRNNPGVCSSKIGEMINLKRNSVKYHVDKLLADDFIYRKPSGRKNLLYAHSECEKNEKS